MSISAASPVVIVGGTSGIGLATAKAAAAVGASVVIGSATPAQEVCLSEPTPLPARPATWQEQPRRAQTPRVRSADRKLLSRTDTGRLYGPQPLTRGGQARSQALTAVGMNANLAPVLEVFR